MQEAKTAKKDEFYTQLKDIENELRHYRHHFKDKVVYCNCDDPKVSNFFKYFALNFQQLGLKKLISSCYRNMDEDLFSEGSSEKAIWLEYRGELDGNMPDDSQVKVHEFEGDGDFRSKESIKLLQEADIVVTNPPFSLFREYLSQLMTYDKKFIIMGNNNSIPVKGVFQLLKENKIWLGYATNKSMEFQVPDTYPLSGKSTRQDENGCKYVKVSAISWFTNLDINKRHEEQVLYKKYTPSEYPTYDNYNAIEVSKVKDIPLDYEGVMGVPITFMDKYNPDQFDILGVSKTWATDFEVSKVKVYKNARQHYQDGRTIAGGKINDGAVLAYENIPDKGIYYTADETAGYLKQTYPRIFIKKKG